jgi:hypothetical protein
VSVAHIKTQVPTVRTARISHLDSMMLRRGPAARAELRLFLAREGFDLCRPIQAERCLSIPRAALFFQECVSWLTE